MVEVRVMSGPGGMHNLVFRGIVSITEELRLLENQKAMGKPTNYSYAG